PGKKSIIYRKFPLSRKKSIAIDIFPPKGKGNFIDIFLPCLREGKEKVIDIFFPCHSSVRTAFPSSIRKPPCSLSRLRTVFSVVPAYSASSFRLAFPSVWQASNAVSIDPLRSFRRSSFDRRFEKFFFHGLPFAV